MPWSGAVCWLDRDPRHGRIDAGDVVGVAGDDGVGQPRITGAESGHIPGVRSVSANTPHDRPADAPGRAREREPVSALVPATGVVLLAVLWLFSAFDGWAAAAFCTERGLGGACRAEVAAAVRPSVFVAVLAALLAVGAGLARVVVTGAEQARSVRVRLFAASVACWLLALAVLFAAGEAAGR